MKSSINSDRIFYKTPAMDWFVSVDSWTGPNPNLITLTKDPYLSLLVVFVLSQPIWTRNIAF
jgi:hypothetical protein